MWFASKNCRYGNIYFKEDSFPGCETARVCDDVPDETALQIKQKFTIGPAVAPGFWEAERANMTIDRGPCKSSIAA